MSDFVPMHVEVTAYAPSSAVCGTTVQWAIA